MEATDTPLPGTVFSPGWSGFTDDWFSCRIPSWKKHVLPHLENHPVQWLEVGSYEGRSAIWALRNLAVEEGSRVLCVDPWVKDELFERFKSNIHAAAQWLKSNEPNHKGEIHYVRGYSQNALRDRHGPFDGIYIDGDHQAKSCLTDAVLAWQLLKPGGFMIFDDYQWDYKSPHDKATKIPACKGIDAFLKFWQNELTVVHHGYQVIVRKKQ